MLRATAVATLAYGLAKLAEHMLICSGTGVQTSYFALQHQACTHATGEKGEGSYHKIWRLTCSCVLTEDLAIAGDVASSGTRLAPVIAST